MIALSKFQRLLNNGRWFQLATLVIELYSDCTVASELRRRRELILRKIQRFARKNKKLEELYEHLHTLEYSIYDKRG